MVQISIMEKIFSETINYEQARAIMELRNAHGVAKPFSIGFVTFNKTTGEGGDYVELPLTVLLDNSMALSKKSPKQNLKIERELEKGITPKGPNHWVNQTKNFAVLVQNPDGGYDRERIVKIHLRLILTINGKEIIW